MMKYVFVSDGKLYCKSIDNRKISVKDGKIICDFSKDPEDWITINGAHVELGEGGQVVGGAGGKFNGSTYKGTQKTKHTQQKSGTTSSQGGGSMNKIQEKLKSGEIAMHGNSITGKTYEIKEELKDNYGAVWNQDKGKWVATKGVELDTSTPNNSSELKQKTYNSVTTNLTNYDGVKLSESQYNSVVKHTENQISNLREDAKRISTENPREQKRCDMWVRSAENSLDHFKEKQKNGGKYKEDREDEIEELRAKAENPSTNTSKAERQYFSKK